MADETTGKEHFIMFRASMIFYRDTDKSFYMIRSWRMLVRRSRYHSDGSVLPSRITDEWSVELIVLCKIVECAQSRVDETSD